MKQRILLTIMVCISSSYLFAANFDRTRFSGNEECKNFLDALEHMKKIEVLDRDNLVKYKLEKACILVNKNGNGKAMQTLICPHEIKIKYQVIGGPTYGTSTFELGAENLPSQDWANFLPCARYQNFRRDE